MAYSKAVGRWYLLFERRAREREREREREIFSFERVKVQKKLSFMNILIIEFLVDTFGGGWGCWCREAELTGRAKICSNPQNSSFNKKKKNKRHRAVLNPKL
jgi:hypothetical protein